MLFIIIFLININPSICQTWNFGYQSGCMSDTVNVGTSFNGSVYKTLSNATVTTTSFVNCEEAFNYQVTPSSTSDDNLQYKASNSDLQHGVTYNPECVGSFNCVGPPITPTQSIHVHGTYSLNPNIANNAMTVKLWRYYAGFGAQISTIECNDNECYMMYIDCSGTCIYINTNNPIQTIVPIQNIISFDDTGFIYPNSNCDINKNNPIEISTIDPIQNIVRISVGDTSYIYLFLMILALLILSNMITISNNTVAVSDSSFNLKNKIHHLETSLSKYENMMTENCKTVSILRETVCKIEVQRDEATKQINFLFENNNINDKQIEKLKNKNSELKSLADALALNLVRKEQSLEEALNAIHMLNEEEYEMTNNNNNNEYSISDKDMEMSHTKSPSITDADILLLSHNVSNKLILTH